MPDLNSLSPDQELALEAAATNLGGELDGVSAQLVS
jgi:hypothetical protein